MRTLLLRSFDGPVYQSIPPSPGPFSPTTRKAAEMSFLATPLAFLVFFSGFALAQINSPNCESTWAWVCILPFPSSDLMTFLSSHSILSTKIRVKLQRTCWRHVMGAVSRCLFDLPCIGEPYRPLSFAAFTISPLQQGYSYFGPSGVDDSNLCKCSTVGYSLLSACGGCQGQTWVTYDSCYCYLLDSWDLCICI
jgi:hypothetical protein